MHTVQFPVTHEIADLYRGADAPALVAFMTKYSMDSLYTSKLAAMQKTIEGKLISGLREYRSGSLQPLFRVDG